MAGNPQVIGLEMALAFCTRRRGSTSSALFDACSVVMTTLPLFGLDLFMHLVAPFEILWIADGQRVTQLSIEPVGKQFAHPLGGVGRQRQARLRTRLFNALGV